MFSEQLNLLGYNAVNFVETQSTFRRNISADACRLLHAGFLLALLFGPEDDADIFLRNVG
jgi:hypothetical protein